MERLCFDRIEECIVHGSELGPLENGKDFKKDIDSSSKLNEEGNEFVRLKYFGFGSDIGRNRKKKDVVELFMDKYEGYQSDCATTLTEALRGFSRLVSQIGDEELGTHCRVIVLNARICDKCEVLTLSSPVFKNREYETLGNDVSVITIEIAIPSALFKDALTEELVKDLKDTKGKGIRHLANGEKYLCAAAKYGAIDSIGPEASLRQWAKQIFLLDEEGDGQRQEHIVDEAIKVIYGTIVNMAFVLAWKGRLSDAGGKQSWDCRGVTLDIVHAINTKGNKEALYARVGDEFDLFDQECGQIWRYLVEPLRANEDTDKGVDTEIDKLVCDTLGLVAAGAKKKESSWVNDLKREKDVRFIHAIRAALNLANSYRAVAVHEGKEQELNILVGKEAELGAILKEHSHIQEEAHELVSSSHKVGRDEYSNIRAVLKSCCSVLNQNRLCILLDPSNENRGGSSAEENGGEGDSGFYWGHVKRFEPPVFRFPKAKILSEVIHDPGVALVRVVSRNRMELYYGGRCCASWTNAHAGWREAHAWSKKDLNHVISRLMLCGIGGKKGASRRRTIARIVEAVSNIAATHDEGGAVLLVSDPKFDLTAKRTAGESYGTSYQCLADRIMPMTDYPYNGLVYLDDIRKHKIGIGDVQRMIAMDGGTVVNIHSGSLWARRKFMGHRKFGRDYPIRVEAENLGHNRMIKGSCEGEAGDGGASTLEDRWKNDSPEFDLRQITSGQNLFWEDRVRFKEWGTRHQSALALTGLCLDCSESDHETKRLCESPPKKPRFLILTVSSDGDITLMRNGTVIAPNRVDAWCTI